MYKLFRKESKCDDKYNYSINVVMSKNKVNSNVVNTVLFLHNDFYYTCL